MSTRQGRLTTGDHHAIAPARTHLGDARRCPPGLSTTAAHADRWWGRDAARDVTQIAFTPEPPPCGSWEVTTQPQDAATDLVGLSVVHGRDDVVLRAHFRDLTGFADRYVSFELATDGRDFEVALHERRRSPVAELWSAPPEPEEVDECGNLLCDPGGSAVRRRVAGAAGA